MPREPKIIHVSDFPLDEDFDPYWDDGGTRFDDDCYPCVICGNLIGDEVAYGDDWGEGPICAGCAGLEDEEE